LANEKILIVEDEEIVVLDIKSALERLGYVVADTANSGDAAIEKTMEVRPDLVLMDIVLKGELDGIDAAEKITALFNIPVIYLTAHTDEATLKRAKVSGPFGYIVKPFRERDLHIAIEFALYKSSVEREKTLLIHRLQDALARVKTLKRLLPICSVCKKIRDDKGYWNQIELYLKNNSDAEFTHSYCPDCAARLIGDPDKDKLQ
jgi:CheY-like chemotaxis protein